MSIKPLSSVPAGIDMTPEQYVAIIIVLLICLTVGFIITVVGWHFALKHHQVNDENTSN